jgi:hypothetical protein
LFIHREKKAFAIFVRSALKGQGEMAAANLCMIGKLVYGEIIRKIGFQGENEQEILRKSGPRWLVALSSRSFPIVIELVLGFF